MTSSLTNQEEKPRFFAVSLLKLTVMSVVSLGFYQIWWAFKNWKFVHEEMGRKISPFWRAWFGIFFMYSLLREIRQTGEKAGYKASLPGLLIYLAWVFMQYSSSLYNSYYHLHVPTADASTLAMLDNLHGIFILVSLMSFLPLLYVQKYINGLNQTIDPNCKINSQFTMGNWIWIVIGSLMLLLVTIGIVHPHPSTHLPQAKSTSFNINQPGNSHPSL